MFNGTVRVSQTPKTPIQSALQRLSHGSYYAARTQEVLGKAEAALDGFVGSAMNISHDNAERDVSRLGRELAAKVRRGERYITRGEVNQSAYNNALTDAADFMKKAVSEESQESQRQELSSLLARLKSISEDTQVEQGIGGVKSLLDEECKPRLDDVMADTAGRDVHHHGRPIWNTFENSMVGLNSTEAMARKEKQSLEQLISDLEAVNAK